MSSSTTHHLKPTRPRGTVRTLYRILLEAGVRAIVQPGGSIRDDDVIAAANQFGATMYFTGERHFFH